MRVLKGVCVVVWTPQEMDPRMEVCSWGHWGEGSGCGPHQTTATSLIRRARGPAKHCCTRAVSCRTTVMRLFHPGAKGNTSMYVPIYFLLYEPWEGSGLLSPLGAEWGGLRLG